jgi:hypothetical protein
LGGLPATLVIAADPDNSTRARLLPFDFKLMHFVHQKAFEGEGPSKALDA